MITGITLVDEPENSASCGDGPIVAAQPAESSAVQEDSLQDLMNQLRQI